MNSKIELIKSILNNYNTVEDDKRLKFIIKTLENYEYKLEQLKADRLEMAREIMYSGNKVFNYQLSKATPNQCVDFVARSMDKVFLKAEKIIKESE